MLETIFDYLADAARWNEGQTNREARGAIADAKDGDSTMAWAKVGRADAHDQVADALDGLREQCAKADDPLTEMLAAKETSERTVETKRKELMRFVRDGHYWSAIVACRDMRINQWLVNELKTIEDEVRNG